MHGESTSPSVDKYIGLRVDWLHLYKSLCQFQLVLASHRQLPLSNVHMHNTTLPCRVVPGMSTNTDAYMPYELLGTMYTQLHLLLCMTGAMCTGTRPDRFNTQGR